MRQQHERKIRPRTREEKGFEQKPEVEETLKVGDIVNGSDAEGNAHRGKIIMMKGPKGPFIIETDESKW